MSLIIVLLCIVGAVVLIHYLSNSSSTPSGATRFYSAPGDEDEKPQASAESVNMMPASYNDGTGEINRLKVAKVREAGAAIQSQITHNHMKKTGGYNPVLQIRSAPEGPKVRITERPVFLSSSFMEDNLN